MKTMLTRLRPGGGMLVAVLALFLALGGTATAAKLITGSQIKNSTLTGADVKNSSLTGGDLKNGSVGPADLSAAAKGAAGAAGSAGPAGPAGPAGAPGAQGAPGAKGDTGAAGANGSNGVNGANGADGDDAGSAFMGRTNGLSTADNAVEFGFVNAPGTASGVENDRAMISPNAPIRASALVVALNVAPGAGDTRTFRMEVNGISSSVACVISGGNTSCTNNSSTVIAPGSFLTFRTATSGTPAAANALYSIRTSGV